jgi:hypothetical protein
MRRVNTCSLDGLCGLSMAHAAPICRPTQCHLDAAAVVDNMLVIDGNKENVDNNGLFLTFIIIGLRFNSGNLCIQSPCVNIFETV